MFFFKKFFKLINLIKKFIYLKSIFLAVILPPPPPPKRSVWKHTVMAISPSCLGDGSDMTLDRLCQLVDTSLSESISFLEDSVYQLVQIF